MRKTQRYILAVVSIIALLFWVSGFKYNVLLISTQLKISSNTVPITECLKDTTYSSAVKNKLKKVDQILIFISEDLKIPLNKHYKTYYNQKGKTVLWQLYVSNPYLIKAQKVQKPWLSNSWSTISYNSDKIKRREIELQNEGYETLLVAEKSFCSLGWINEPLLSGMLAYSDVELTRNIIKNLMLHAITKSPALATPKQKSLANVIAEKGALQFLKTQKNINQQTVKDYENNQNDYLKFTNHIINGAKKLDSLYRSFDANTPLLTKESKKQQLIKHIVNSLAEVDFHLPELYLNHFYEEGFPNNAYFLNYIDNRKYQEYFLTELKTKHNKDLKSFIKFHLSEPI